MRTTGELAAYLTGELGIETSAGALRLWRHRKTGPAWHKISGRVYYAAADVRAWLASTRHEARAS